MATGWAMRPTIRLWRADDTARTHNRHHTVQTGSCPICRAHGNAVVIHPITGRAI